MRRTKKRSGRQLMRDAPERGVSGAWRTALVRRSILIGQGFGSIFCGRPEFSYKPAGAARGRFFPTLVSVSIDRVFLKERV
jgi:hypothetical protein